MKMMRKLALLIAAPLLLVAACSGAQSAPTAQGRGGEVGAPAPGAVDSAAGYSGIAATAPNKDVPTVVVSGDRNLILTAKIDMRSKDPWATSDRAQAIATGLGGDVLNLSQSGTADTRSASLTIRVPSSRTSPWWPLSIAIAPIASQWPLVGGALNWQGQPYEQLQLMSSRPSNSHGVMTCLRKQ